MQSSIGNLKGAIALLASPPAGGLASRGKALEKQGAVAQLVQSTCFASRGSGVRIPAAPQP